MTLHTSPADPGPHAPSLEDPSELLAQSRLCLREPPSDCLLLAGHGGSDNPPVLTSSPLRDLLAPCGGDRLADHLDLLRRRGIDRVQALVVIGDGYQPVLESVTGDVLRRAGEVLHAAADDSLPVLRSMRAAADGTAWEMLPPRGGEGPGAVRVARRDRLLEFPDTLTAASAVFTGHPLPHGTMPRAALERIGRSLRIPAPDLRSTANPGELFAEARAALERVRRRAAESEQTEQTESMTECEPIAELLSALAVDRLHWELLAQCVEHGSAASIDRERLLDVLVSDRRWAPHADVCAGGSWYVAIEQLRVTAAAALDQAPAAERRAAGPAWRALTSLLVMLAWWNHRFATAGGLIDELRAREPDSTLAPLLLRMTDTPIRPAWWPSR